MLWSRILKKALVLGSTGLLGSHLVNVLKSNYTVSGTNHRNQPTTGIESFKIDASRFDELEQLIINKDFDLVINCIGLTNIEECERRPEAAWQINATLPFYLSKATLRSGAKLIHISTDHFYSDLQSPRSEEVNFIPVNHYGYTKIAGERFVIETNPSALVLRTNFFGISKESNHSLLDFLVGKILINEKIVGFNDVIFNPLGVSELSRLILTLADLGLAGIFHTAGQNPISKYEFAVLVGKCLQKSTEAISQGSAESPQIRVNRPKYLALDGSKLWGQLGINPPSIEFMLSQELKNII